MLYRHMMDGLRAFCGLLAGLGVLLICLPGLVGAVPIADDPATASGASADNETLGIHEVAVSGDGYIDEQDEIVLDHPGPPYVWSTEGVAFTVTVGGEMTDEEYALCGEATDSDGEVLSDLGCESVTLTGGEQEIVFEVEEWLDETEGDVWVTLELQNDAGEMIQYETAPITLIHPDGDLSGDRLTNAEEVRYGTDFTTPDTTGNGLTDWEEIRVHESDPLATDTSGDGVGDATAVRLGLDPTIPYLPYVYVGGGLVVIVLLVAGGGALGWQFMRRYNAADEPAPAMPDEDRSADPDLPAESTPVATSSTAEPEQEGPPLTKEEEVCRLLGEHDGRMKQSQLVAQTEWSQATVSRLVSKLEREGSITKLRTGRENIVELRTTEPESEPESTDV
ncbi:MAG: helix-turn-helix domain-containing protein [Euryarchaeota archaeon]|nr:helix-turn-helix domain-containing protein [Euryarchaeota archaeon]